MADIQLAADQPQPTGPVVWILSEGEMHEGGKIIDVYLDRDLAQGDFMEQAAQIAGTFGIDEVRPEENGSLRVYGGCDWLALEPHTVRTRRALDA
jgi:hypothetical protein